MLQSQIYGVFTLPDTHTDTETDTNTDNTIQPIFVGLCIGLFIGQCVNTPLSVEQGQWVPKVKYEHERSGHRQTRVKTLFSRNFVPKKICKDVYRPQQ